MITALSTIHPAVSGFSLAFLLLLCWLDGRSFVVSRSLSSQGPVLLAALSIALLITFFSGYLAEGFLYPSLDPLIAERVADHHVRGRWALISLPIVAVIRHLAARRRDRPLAVLYAVTLVMFGLLLISGGHLGGELVFEYGVGVRRRG